VDYLFAKAFRKVIYKLVLIFSKPSGKLRVFENIVLRRIFGPRRDEVTVEWRRLHNEELNSVMHF